MVPRSRRIVRVGVSAAVLLASTAIAAGAGGGASSSSRGAIVFSLDLVPAGLGPSRQVVMRVGADGSGLRKLTRGGRSEFEPVWSPDGRSIAFARANSTSPDDGSNIWTMGADGSRPRQLTHDARAFDVYPAWSADGKAIVYQGAGRRLWAIGSKGGRPLPLTPAPPPGLADTAPSLSRDGRRLVFVRISPVSPPRGAIWIAKADGSRAHALTSMATRYWLAAPRLSPDGRMLAYVATVVNEPPHLRLMRSDGSGDVDTHLLGGSPAFAPDGSLLACLCWRGSLESFGVQAFDPRTGATRPLLRIGGLHADSGGLDWASRG